MSNSIRVVEQQKGKGAAVTSVRQLFQKPTIKRKVVALIEGPDDKECYGHLLSSSSVFLLPINIRFHEYVVNSLDAVYPTKLISIKDADFCHANNVGTGHQNMFHTDAHDLETMMLKGGNLSALAVEYSGLTAGIDENALCDALLKYSYLKWYNYNERTKLAFWKLNTVDLFEKGRLNDSVALFTELCNCSSKHQAVYNDYLTFCQNHPIVDIWFVTNGHDLMDCIYSEMHKRKRGNLPKDEVIKSFYKNYNIEMFQKTELYAQLSAWGEQNGRALFVAA